MGAFEDFVNANLGIRKPLIFDFAPPTGADKSLKAAGVRGAHFLDLNSNFLYEKTGENNNTDWIKIAKLGDSRGEPGGSDTNIQFVSGDKLAGSDHLIYNYNSNQLSGASGHFDNFSAQDGFISNDLHVSGDLHISGKTYVNEILDYTVTGSISGHSGFYHHLYSDFFTGNTGHYRDEIIVGEAGEEDGVIIDGGNIIAGGSFEMSGELLVGGKDVIREISGTSEGLSGVSGSLELLGDSVGFLSGESTANFIALGDDISLVSDEIDAVSGEALANSIALSDDISLVSDELSFVSGDSTANFVALSDDISIINQKIPFFNSLSLPINLISTGIAFADLGNSTNYPSAPLVQASMRYTGLCDYAYNHLLHNVTHTGFHIDFSDFILESNHILDIFIYYND